ncbi:MAG: hypothetical protein V3U46_11930 [Acidimicrobiia bacterium]
MTNHRIDTSGWVTERDLRIIRRMARHLLRVGAVRGASTEVPAMAKRLLGRLGRVGWGKGAEHVLRIVGEWVTAEEGFDDLYHLAGNPRRVAEVSASGCGVSLRARLGDEEATRARLAD